jgi:hypothetical protein
VRANSATIGTGFLAAVSTDPELSKRVVVTAAHVIPFPFNWFERDEVGAKPVAGLAIRYPGFMGQKQLDVGLLLLEERVTDATPLQFGPSLPEVGADVAFIGERNGTRVGLGSIGSTFPNTFGANVFQVDPKGHVAEEGDSGGPILARFGGDNLVIGVNGFLYRRGVLGFAFDDIVDRSGVPTDWPLYSGNVRVDNGSGLASFVHGEHNNVNLIAVRPPNVQAYIPWDLDELDKLDDPTNKVLFSNLSESQPEKKKWAIHGDFYGFGGHEPLQVRGILNKDDLNVYYREYMVIDEEGSTYPARILDYVGVVNVGDSGILNAKGGRFNVVSGGVITAMFHNRGTLDVSPFTRRPHSPTPLENHRGEFPAWLVVNGPLLNEGEMVNNRGRVIVSKSCLDCLSSQLGVTAGMGDEETGADFLQTAEGVLSIVWDASLHAQFPPFEVEGDALVKGRVEVALPNTVPFTEGLKLRLFEVGGLSNLSQAKASIKFGERAYPARFSVENGEVSVIAPSRNLGLSVSWINSATGEVSFGGADSFDADRPSGWNGFSWGFGDGETTRGYFPQFHVYSDLATSYTASVTSEYSDSTSDTKTVSISFLSTPPITIGNFSRQDGPGGTIEFTVTGSGFVNGSVAEFRTPDRGGWLPATNIQVIDAQTLKGTINAAGFIDRPWDVIVFNPDRQAAAFRISLFQPGDFDHDGDVDGADYLGWQRTFGSSGTGLSADWNGNGTVDAADYVVWRNNFHAASSLSEGQTSVPESSSIVLLSLGGLAILASMRMPLRR